MGAASRRVLLTGSRGFTGHHLRAELEKAGHTVFGLTDTGRVAARELVADLRDARAVREVIEEVRPELVVHLGAISFVAHDAVSDVYAVNVLGTVHLLDALSRLQTRPTRVILASSSNVYGNAARDPIDEQCPLAPISHYAASKAAMEAVAQGFRARLPIVVTRPFNYTGPGQDPKFFVPKVVQHFRDRAARIELGNLDVERDFLDVRTVANIYRRLLESDRDAPVLNICSGRGLRLRAIIDMLRDLTGHAIETAVNQELVRGNDIQKLVGDNRALHAAIGEIAEIPFETTLRDMLGVTMT